MPLLSTGGVGFGRRSSPWLLAIGEVYPPGVGSEDFVKADAAAEDTLRRIKEILAKTG